MKQDTPKSTTTFSRSATSDVAVEASTSALSCGALAVATCVRNFPGNCTRQAVLNSCCPMRWPTAAVAFQRAVLTGKKTKRLIPPFARDGV